MYRPCITRKRPIKYITKQPIGSVLNDSGLRPREMVVKDIYSVCHTFYTRNEKSIDKLCKQKTAQGFKTMTLSFRATMRGYRFALKKQKTYAYRYTIAKSLWRDMHSIKEALLLFGFLRMSRYGRFYSDERSKENAYITKSIRLTTGLAFTTTSIFEDIYIHNLRSVAFEK